MSATNECGTSPAPAHSQGGENEPEYELGSLSSIGARSDHSAEGRPEESGQDQAPSGLVPSSQARGSRLDKLSFWIGVGVTGSTLVVAIYYGFWSLQMQKWQARNDYRDTCIAYLVSIF